MRVLLRGVALGMLIASCAACMPWQQWRTPTAAADRRVVVCSGQGSFASCKTVNAETYRLASRNLQNPRPLTGTRIGTGRRSR